MLSNFFPIVDKCLSCEDIARQICGMVPMQMANFWRFLRFVFQPIAVETLGPINGSAVSFLSGLGRRIADVSGETREGSFLFQRLSVLIQRFNAVVLHDCFVDEVAGHSS